MEIAIQMENLTKTFGEVTVVNQTRLLPWGQAAMALRTWLNAGGAVQDVWPQVGLMMVETAVIFLVGVILFARMRLR